MTPDELQYIEHRLSAATNHQIEAVMPPGVSLHIHIAKESVHQVHPVHKVHFPKCH